MKLYHGSNIAIATPRIIESDRKLDFGTGFYLTTSLEQAKDWARLTTSRRKEGTATISVFEFSDASGLKVTRFSKANKKWLDFVFSNRIGPGLPSTDDIIIGPVANDNTMPTLRLFFLKALDASATIKQLQTQNLVDQYVFKTDMALSHLKFIEAVSNER